MMPLTRPASADFKLSAIISPAFSSPPSKDRTLVLGRTRSPTFTSWMNNQRPSRRMAVSVLWVNDRNRPSGVLIVRLPSATLGMKLCTTPLTNSSFRAGVRDSNSSNR